MKHSDNVNLVFGALILAFIMVAGTGWFMNIMKIFGTTDTTEFIIRIIGIFVSPAGAIMGYF